jgi:integrase/recombinase XerD
MKQQLPLSDYYREVLGGLRQELKVLGYHSKTQLLSGVVEFLRCMEKQGISQLDQVTAGQIKAHYAYLLSRPTQRGTPLSAHTITGYLYEISLLFAYGLSSGLIDQNPYSGLCFPKAPKSERAIVSRAEIGRLYAACRDAAEQSMLGLFYGCGLRLGEAQQLNIRDIDLRAGLLYVRQGKGKKRRVVPVPKQVISHFKGYLYGLRPQQISRFTKGNHAKAFMLNGRGRRMRGQTYWKRLRAFLQRIGETQLLARRISPHALRHSIATHLLADGMRIERVRDFLGHNHLETTQLYTRVEAEQLNLQLWI